MTARAKTLQRLADVQKQMVRLSEWRVAGAERARRDLAEQSELLSRYVVEEGALGEPLARAALRSLHRLDGQLSCAERKRETDKAALVAAKRREHVVDALADTATKETRRASNRADLAQTIEAWLVACKTSLP